MAAPSLHLVSTAAHIATPALPHPLCLLLLSNQWHYASRIEHHSQAASHRLLALCQTVSPADASRTPVLPSCKTDQRFRSLIGPIIDVDTCRDSRIVDIVQMLLGDGQTIARELMTRRSMADTSAEEPQELPR